jgi:hypothetical protein
MVTFLNLRRNPRCEEMSLTLLSYVASESPYQVSELLPNQGSEMSLVLRYSSPARLA